MHPAKLELIGWMILVGVALYIIALPRICDWLADCGYRHKTEIWAAVEEIKRSRTPHGSPQTGDSVVPQDASPDRAGGGAPAVAVEPPPALSHPGGRGVTPDPPRPPGPSPAGAGYDPTPRVRWDHPEARW